jgi:hypothetical protein
LRETKAQGEAMRRTSERENVSASGDRRGERGFFQNARSFVLGGVVGASAALAARRRRRPRLSDGLSAFEDAPCYRESAERRR